ncbi:hypothetical protein [Cerasicoccus frondis]|uniref:hypothetical protein n=1 Tax=Cerasicoccus frondis TaxID=490090 RepID=UPI0028526623|nr:hypothetical protein [Cerasicoccus frondis]
MIESPFYKRLNECLHEQGGIFNAHLHLDRAGTLHEKYFAGVDHEISRNFHLSLHEKHHLIGAVHAGRAYEPEDLRERIELYLNGLIDCGTRRADTLTDTTADRVKLNALEIALDLKHKYRDSIDLQVAAYSPLGFRDDEPERWEILQAAAQKADFLSALPEADDQDEYPEHIGFMEHCRRFLELGQELGKPIHVHTDQRNEPSESGTERLVEAVRRWGAPQSPNGDPMVWAVHLISPSTYDDDRFNRLVDGMLETGIGVICCPSAAVGMRQLRAINTPTYNCIPRLLEFAAAGVPIRLASDNIADICSPSTTEDLRDEVFMLSAALRFYNADILATFAAGKPLSDKQRALVSQHLEANAAQIAKWNVAL